MAAKSDRHTSSAVPNANATILKRFWRSIWLFPAVLTLILVLLTALKISGSSLGVYHTLFYGPAATDHNLLANEPRAIRSDEWIVNTQMAIAQKNDGYHRINDNIGDGEDVSLMVDAPYREWSTLFKPHNLGFLVLPFDNGFAFHWWIMGYLLILSLYFFVLALLPGRRLLASMLGLALFFSPFIQWWYLYGTLGALYFALFAGTAVIKLLGEKRLAKSVLWGGVLAYSATAFAVILYPPYQIPVALAMGAFLAGYIIERFRRAKKKSDARRLVKQLGIAGGALVVASLLVGVYVIARQGVIHTVANTVYPGKRVVASGGYDMTHLFSSHLSPQFQDDKKAAPYFMPEKGLSNQSENSNFILLLPLLFLPGLWLLVEGYRKKRTLDWPLLAVSVFFVLVLVRLFVPHTDLLFKLLLLESVPHNRLLIGLGLASFMYIVLLIRNLDERPRFPFPKLGVWAYVAAIFLLQVWLGFDARRMFPGFVSIKGLVALSVPLTLVVYLLLTKRFKLAAFGLLVFSFVATHNVNPLYRGTAVLTQTPLSQAIQKAAAKRDGLWVTESAYLENFALMNGAHSLTGVYTYPQLNLWKHGIVTTPDVYNRYAHTNVVLDRAVSTQSPDKLELAGGDRFGVIAEPCGPFLRQQNVHYAVAELPIQDSCAQLLQSVTYPTRTVYIYRLN